MFEATIISLAPEENMMHLTPSDSKSVMASLMERSDFDEEVLVLFSNCADLLDLRSKIDRAIAKSSSLFGFMKVILSKIWLETQRTDFGTEVGSKNNDTPCFEQRSAVVIIALSLRLASMKTIFD